jgi:hypothetical protein
MIAFIVGLFVGSSLGILLMAVMSVSSHESRLEERNPPFICEPPSRPAQAEVEAFWEEQ